MTRKTLPRASKLLVISNRLPVSIRRAEKDDIVILGGDVECDPTITRTVKGDHYEDWASKENREKAENKEKRNRKCDFSHTLPERCASGSVNPRSTDFTFTKSTGGLATALIFASKSLDFKWIGNLSASDYTVPEMTQLERDLSSKFRAEPIFVEKTIIDRACNGFSNCVLWPFFHNFIHQIDYEKEYLEGYKLFNRAYCEKISRRAGDGDVVWIHDYHFLLLPQMLREVFGGRIRVGLSMHIPFPEPSCFHVLPELKLLVGSMVLCDLVTFHCPAYRANFVEACNAFVPNIRHRLVPGETPGLAFTLESRFEPKLKASGDGMHIRRREYEYAITPNTWPTRKVITNNLALSSTVSAPNSRRLSPMAAASVASAKSVSCLLDDVNPSLSVHSIPIGIEAEVFKVCLQQPTTRNLVNRLRIKFASKTIIVGVDRVDYIKGLPQKLDAFEAFLRATTSKMATSTVLIQVGVPSRGHIGVYKSSIAQIESKVAYINSNYRDVSSGDCNNPVENGRPAHARGGLNGPAVFFLNRELTFPELCAFYAVADVCLITSLIDGMNLVALEFVAAKCEGDPGVLVLSKNVGAASVLVGALLVDPFDSSGVAMSLLEAVQMGRSERMANFLLNTKAVEKFSAKNWASAIYGCLRGDNLEIRRCYGD